MKSKKDMVLQFRIAELQTFLEAFGERNLKLRKRELQKKALDIVNHNRSRIVGQKIKSLYNRMNSSRQNATSTYSLRKHEFLDKKHISGRNFHFSESPELSPYYDDDFYAADNYSDAHFPAFDPSGPLDLSENSSYVSKLRRIDVEGIKNLKFDDLPFYEHVADLMLVTPLVPVSDKPIDNLFEFRATFSLNAEAVRCLFRSTDLTAKYEAMFRLCVFDERLQVEDSMPQKLYLTVNNRFCSCVPDNYTSKNDTSGKRTAVPMNITPYLDRNLLMHQVIVHWSASCQTMFAASVQLVKRRSTDQLIQSLVAKGEQDPSVSKRFIYKNLNDEDDDIGATSLKLSLICPLGKMLMTYPCRGTTCNHLQCFDGALYIKMNEIKCTWQCPVCHQTCLYQNLFIDGYFMDIFRSDKFKPDMKDVQLSADGSWESATTETKKRPKTSSPVKVPEKTARVEEPCDRTSSGGDQMLSSGGDRMLSSGGDRMLPTSDPGLGEGSISDDLHAIFSSLINSSESRSHYPEFSIYDDGFMDLAQSRSSNQAPVVQPSPTYSPHIPESPASQKSVMLVDLTIDSESDDEVRSTSSSSTDTSIEYCTDRDESNAVSDMNAFILPHESLRDFADPSSPPVYDIDSD